jgi:hypothetical protein
VSSEPEERRPPRRRHTRHSEPEAWSPRRKRGAACQPDHFAATRGDRRSATQAGGTPCQRGRRGQGPRQLAREAQFRGRADLIVRSRLLSRGGGRCVRRCGGGRVAGRRRARSRRAGASTAEHRGGGAAARCGRLDHPAATMADLLRMPGFQGDQRAVAGVVSAHSVPTARTLVEESPVLAGVFSRRHRDYESRSPLRRTCKSFVSAHLPSFCPRVPPHRNMGCLLRS